MDFFRRDKDPNEEWRRTRKTLEQRLEHLREEPRGSSDRDAAQESWSQETQPTQEEWEEEFDQPMAEEQREEALDQPVAEGQREEEAGPADPLAHFRRGATMVAKDSTFSGMLQSRGNLFIEGNFDGELDARDTVVIAETADVKADVRATDVIVAGRLDGTVDATGRFHAMPTARVAAEITSASLRIEQGSHIDCRFAMKAREEANG
ncbi:MAG: polymer-forming cytoskeletal protein [Chloroflexota bacterium]|nr:polymer-forming cytoskeletal protein [Chloroflexota bacterium]